MQGISRRYRIIADLPGGMAHVSLAEDTQHYNEKVVIKQFKSGVDDSLHRLQKLFEREIQVLRNLDHPHIIKIRDWASSSEHNVSYSYYVMAFMEGGSLQQKIDQRKIFTLSETIEILRPLTQALDYAHAKGVRHFDIKPANILFDSQGELYLSDFGLALDSDVTVVQMDGIGTASYMSPEQLNVERRDLDHRADLYALGVVIFQMLAGTLPFTGSLEAIIVQHITEQVPDIYFHCPELPIGLQSFLDKAMAKDRDMRFSSAGEMLDALQTIMATVSPPVAPVHPLSVTPSTQQATTRFPPPVPPAPLGNSPVPFSRRVSYKQLGVLLIVLLLCSFVFLIVTVIVIMMVNPGADPTATGIAKVTQQVTQTLSQTMTPDVEPVPLETVTIAPSPSFTLFVEATATMSPLPTATVTLSVTPTETPTPTGTATPTFGPTVVPRIQINNLNSCDEAGIAKFTGFPTIQFEWVWAGVVDTSRGNYFELRIGPRTGTLTPRARIENEAFYPNRNLWIYTLASELFFNTDYHDYEWQIVYMSRQGQPLRLSAKGCFRITP